jgi:hypothetical protein
LRGVTFCPPRSVKGVVVYRPPASKTVWMAQWSRRALHGGSALSSSSVRLLLSLGRNLGGVNAIAVKHRSNLGKGGSLFVNGNARYLRRRGAIVTLAVPDISIPLYTAGSARSLPLRSRRFPETERPPGQPALPPAGPKPTGPGAPAVVSSIPRGVPIESDRSNGSLFYPGLNTFRFSRMSTGLIKALACNWVCNPMANRIC